jgi:hypothetical protein
VYQKTQWSSGILESASFQFETISEFSWPPPLIKKVETEGGLSARVRYCRSTRDTVRFLMQKREDCTITWRSTAFVSMGYMDSRCRTIIPDPFQTAIPCCRSLPNQNQSDNNKKSGVVSELFKWYCLPSITQQLKSTWYLWNSRTYSGSWNATISYTIMPGSELSYYVKLHWVFRRRNYPLIPFPVFFALYQN